MRIFPLALASLFGIFGNGGFSAGSFRRAVVIRERVFCDAGVSSSILVGGILCEATELAMLCMVGRLGDEIQ